MIKCGICQNLCRKEAGYRSHLRQKHAIFDGDIYMSKVEKVRMAESDVYCCKDCQIFFSCLGSFKRHQIKQHHRGGRNFKYTAGQREKMERKRKEKKRRRKELKKNKNKTKNIDENTNDGNNKTSRKVSNRDRKNLGFKNECPYCKRKFNTFEQTKNHIKQCDKSNQYTIECHICLKLCQKEQGYGTHLQQHNIAIKDVDILEQEKRKVISCQVFACKYCHLFFAARGAVERHIKSVHPK